VSGLGEMRKLDVARRLHSKLRGKKQTRRKREERTDPDGNISFRHSDFIRPTVFHNALLTWGGMLGFPAALRNRRSSSQAFQLI
jgi:hypothetical protein